MLANFLKPHPARGGGDLIGTGHHDQLVPVGGSLPKKISHLVPRVLSGKRVGPKATPKDTVSTLVLSGRNGWALVAIR